MGIALAVLVVVLFFWVMGNGLPKTLAQGERTIKKVATETPKVTAKTLNKGGHALSSGLTMARVKISETKDKSSSGLSNLKTRIAEEREMLAREAGEVDEMRVKRVDSSRMAS